MSKSQSAPPALRTTLVLFAALALAACQTPPSAPERTACPPCAACPTCPTAEPVTPTQPPAKPLQPARWNDLPGWGEDDLAAAWPAFQASCRALAARPGWKRVCGLAGAVDGQDNAALRAFFEQHFRPLALTAPDGKSEGMITGYYEPLLKGSRSRSKAHPVPVLGVPDDLLTIDLGEVLPELKHLRLRGRLQGNKVVPYYSRAEIESGKGGQADKILLWVDDPVELFFLQIQGSGRVRLPDGQMTRLAYADQNGHPYQSIGRVLLERGDLKPGEATMQGIQAWARANPARLNGLLNSNPSYVFFREMPVNGAGPLGALGVPLTAGRSIAVDPRHTPLGAPVFLATTLPNSSQPLNRLMLAQDTGGAIKGVVRADFFWGFGASAGEQAGKMKQSGRMWVLLPNELSP